MSKNQIRILKTLKGGEVILGNCYQKKLLTFSVCLLLFSLFISPIIAICDDNDEIAVFSVTESKVPKKITIKTPDDDLLISASKNVERVRLYAESTKEIEVMEVIVPIKSEPLTKDELVLKEIVDFLIKKGLTDTQVSGIIGNLRSESDLNPAKIQGGEIAEDGYIPVQGVGFGLAQWTDSRQQGLIDLARMSKRDIIDLSLQLDYLWFELQGAYYDTLMELKATDNPVDAAVVFHDGYERSADTHRRVVIARGGNAKDIYLWQQEHAEYLASDNRL